jgi:hypothetical protein
MAGFGTELLLFCGVGDVVLGPKRIHGIHQHIARAKMVFAKTRQGINSPLATELDIEPEGTQT